jgi:hypothetical protein
VAQVGNGLMRSALEMGMNVPSCRTVVDDEWKEMRLCQIFMAFEFGDLQGWIANKAYPPIDGSRSAGGRQ